jgi:hypothetical protein
MWKPASPHHNIVKCRGVHATKITVGSRFVIGFIEHFFTITINYSTIANLHSSLGHVPFLSMYSQLLLVILGILQYIHSTDHTENTASTADEACLPLSCLATDALLLRASVLRGCVTDQLPSKWTFTCLLLFRLLGSVYLAVA